MSLSELEQNNYKQIHLMKSIYDKSYDNADAFFTSAGSIQKNERNYKEPFSSNVEEFDDYDDDNEDDYDDEEYDDFKEGLKNKRKKKGRSKGKDKGKDKVKPLSFFTTFGNKISEFFNGTRVKSVGDLENMNKSYYIILVGIMSIYMVLNSYVRLMGLENQVDELDINIDQTENNTSTPKSFFSSIKDFLSSTKDFFRNNFNSPQSRGFIYILLFASIIGLCDFLFKNISKFADAFIDYKNFSFKDWLYKSETSFLFIFFTVCFAIAFLTFLFNMKYVNPALTLLFLVLITILFFILKSPVVNICILILITSMFIFTCLPNNILSANKMFWWNDIVSHIFSNDDTNFYGKLLFNFIHILIVICSLIFGIYYVSKVSSTHLKAVSITLFLLIILLVAGIYVKDMKNMFPNIFQNMFPTKQL